MERLKVVQHKKHKRTEKSIRPMEICLSDGKLKSCPAVTYTWDKLMLYLDFGGKCVARIPLNPHDKHVEALRNITIDRAIVLTGCSLTTVMELEIRELTRKYK